MLDRQAEQAAAAEQEVRFAAGAQELTGRLFCPAGPARAAVVLNGATGVPQRFYRHFARWLAECRGIACLTYDYNGFGASAARHPRHSEASMAQWALVDQPAAREAMRQCLPGVPLWVLGHSLGAMLMPLQEGISDIQRMIVVASGLVHLRDHPWPYRALAWSFWHGHVPLAVRLMGYLPGRSVGFGADLPSGVYWQWRRWCTTRGSYLPETGKSLPRPDWQRCGAPVDLFVAGDDDMTPAGSVWRLGDIYGGEQHRRVLHPAEFGLQQIGHLGVFAPRSAAVWPQLVPGVD